ncbi:SufE family protein [Litorilinea aerophila]|uniref:SufE family protein n=1 Tax=Litorilinea aerophila TaxID=1204385 RepID=A0A540VA69_9CHLR|nr:SufE family protein [Litorilinea aerophila]MCC9078476.1 SufE family protein [Litorilinea aerophila]
MTTEMSYEDKIAECPPSLQTIIREFREVTPRERLEYLLEYAMDLPELPAHLAEQRDAMEQVHECQTPVFLHTELEDGHVHFYLDIPQESPTVRGYAAVLAEGLNGTSPEEVLATPEDVYLLLGLQEAITPQRLRGLHALMVYMKRQVKRLQ